MKDKTHEYELYEHLRNNINFVKKGANTVESYKNVSKNIKNKSDGTLSTATSNK